MSDAISTFFSAWSETDPSLRRTILTAALTQDCSYADPNSGARLVGIDAINDYLAMFTTNAPGWNAAVMLTNIEHGCAQSLIIFQGIGPDGIETGQYGTYYGTLEGGKLTHLTGFKGFLSVPKQKPVSVEPEDPFAYD